MGNVEKIAYKAFCATGNLINLKTEDKNRALLAVADALEKNKEAIFEANKKDLKEAQALVQSGEITSSTFARLKLDENKMRDMIQGVKDVAKLEDPIGKTLLKRELDEDLILEKISSPIGVIGVIFEARPDVIAQISALAIKTSNAVILKGGKESNHTNAAIFEVINGALAQTGFPNDAINLLFSREDVKEMLKLNRFIDLIIPRGSNELVKYIQQNTKIPVLGHASGVCNIYVDKDADLNKAIKICVDSKCQYPSACNSVENILIHKDFKYADDIKNALIKNGVKIIEVECDTSTPEKCLKELSIEYGEKIVNIVMVKDTFEAIAVINVYGSHHTDCIITEDEKTALAFSRVVDSSGVYHNVSTRFADGYRYGFGAEVGISTNKTHARGPVGLEGLTIYKYHLKGNGHIVADYAEGRKTFKHKNLSLNRRATDKTDAK